MHVCVECSPDLGFRELPEVETAGGLQVLVSQDLFDVPDRAAPLQKGRRSRMSQDMWRNALTKAFEQWPVRASEHRLHAGRLEPLAIRARE